MRMAIVIAGAGLVCGALVFACVGDGPGAANDADADPARDASLDAPGDVSIDAPGPDVVSPPIPGPILWFRADRGVEINDGGMVTRWVDQSGNGNHALRTATGAGPTYAPIGINGLPALSFYDGTPPPVRFLQTALLAPQMQPNTVFAVCEQVGGTGVQSVLDGHDTRHALFLNGDAAAMYAGTANVSTAAVDTTSVLLYTAIFNNAQSSLKVRAGGVDSVAMGNPGADPFDGLTIGVSRLTGVGAWRGFVSEILVYDGAMGVSDRALVETQLRARWRIP